jgi:hypothetical protein
MHALTVYALFPCLHCFTYCRVAEFAPPGELLQNTEGHFSRLMAAERRTANKPDKDSSSSDSDTDSSSDSVCSSDTDAASDSDASDNEDTALLEGMLITML